MVEHVAIAYKLMDAEKKEEEMADPDYVETGIHPEPTESSRAVARQPLLVDSPSWSADL